MAKKLVVTKAEGTTPAVKSNPAPVAKKVTKVTPPTPQPDPKAKKATKPTPEPVPAATEKRVSIHRGVTSGLPVMTYQDQTLLANAKKHLTDEALLADWRKEFPNTNGAWAKDDAVGLRIVAVVRRLFNEKRHGNQKVFADAAILRYGADGKPLAETPRKAKAVATVAAKAA